jgi:RND family efflux transporter MFP subunit
MASDNLALLKIDRSKRRWRVSPWVWGIVVVALGALLSPQLLARWQVAEVGVASVTRVSGATGEPIDGSPDLTAAGYVVADRQSVLAAKFTGRLASLNVSEADFVTKGTVVAEIDHAELDATLVEARAEVAVAAADAKRLNKLVTQGEAEVAAAKAALQTFDAENKQYEVLLADAKRRLDLDEKLASRRVVSTSQLDDRRTEVLAAEAKIAWTKQRKFESERHIAVSEAQTDAARVAVVAAEAKCQAAAAHVAVLESQRDESFIRAPFDGVVTEKAAEVGEIVAPISIGGSMARGSIVTLADWASLQAEVDVAESQLARVKPGQRVAISVDAIPGQVFPGKLRRILPRADRSKATVKVRVDFISRDKQAVLPEMGVRVRFLPDNAPSGLESGQIKEKLVVPEAAVQSNDRGHYVWVVSDSEASRRPVQIGQRNGRNTEITKGLAAGDKVVVRGAEKLSGETATVKVAE